jgi:hypothetical protein
MDSQWKAFVFPLMKAPTSSEPVPDNRICNSSSRDFLEELCALPRFEENDEKVGLRL